MNALVDIRNQGIGQKAVSEAIGVLVNTPADFAPFTYLFTADQFQRLAKLARERFGVAPLNAGLLVTIDTAYHPVESRVQKDGLTTAEICDLLVGAYHKQSQIFENRQRSNQYFMVNERKQHAKGCALLVVEVVAEAAQVPFPIAMEPKTAYWVGQAKLAGIKKRK